MIPLSDGLQLSGWKQRQQQHLIWADLWQIAASLVSEDVQDKKSSGESHEITCRVWEGAWTLRHPQDHDM